MADKINPKHEAVLSKAAAVIRARGHEGDARLADSVTGVLASLRQQANRRGAQPADVGAGELPPIEFDVGMQRTYIPLPGGWEIQTKGNGSTFRIAHVPSQQRWQVLDDRLHEPLEALARDMRNAIAAPPLSSEQQSEKGEHGE